MKVRVPAFNIPKAKNAAESLFAQLVNDTRLTTWFGERGAYGAYLTFFDQDGRRRMACRIGETSETYQRSLEEAKRLFEASASSSRSLLDTKGVAAVRGIQFLSSCSGPCPHACEYFLVMLAVAMGDLSEKDGTLRLLESKNKVAIFLGKAAPQSIVLDI